ncbi:hypothetical protein GCM10023350_03880 [Nocardioides endophyticus]|uniref:Bacterial Ig-like domain-containing protein n=1 Tax=Nocardioides endophyticus TaxID=1353775 RepID=A0ABP8YAC6_9ACTN
MRSASGASSPSTTRRSSREARPRRTVTALKVSAKAKSRVVRLTVRATSPGIAPAGTVVVKVRGKVVARVTLRAGTGTVRVKGLRPGRTTLTASYAGTAVTTSAAAKVTVKVPRR